MYVGQILQEKQMFSLVVKMLSIGSLIPVRFHVTFDKVITETKVSQFVFTHKPKDYGPLVV